MNWEPIDHRPPRPRIETAPRYTPAPQIIPEHIQIQIDHAEKMGRRLEGERIWNLVRQTAEGTNPPAVTP